MFLSSYLQILIPILKKIFKEAIHRTFPVKVLGKVSAIHLNRARKVVVKFRHISHTHLRTECIANDHIKQQIGDFS